MTIDRVKKFALLMFGLFLYSVGILLTIHAHLGTAPWDTFQIGLSVHTGLTLGRVSQVVGVIIIGLNIVLKELPGWGTILNMYFIGYFIDLIERLAIIPNPQGWWGKLVMLLMGIIVTGWATFFYMDAGWGAGPRDGLMLGLSKRFSTKVWKARTAVEVVVAGAGYALGGRLGLGTVLYAWLIGPAIQIVYQIVGKDPKSLRHRTLQDNYQALLAYGGGPQKSKRQPQEPYYKEPVEPVLEEGISACPLRPNKKGRGPVSN